MERVSEVTVGVVHATITIASISRPTFWSKTHLLQPSAQVHPVVAHTISPTFSRSDGEKPLNLVDFGMVEITPMRVPFLKLFINDERAVTVSANGQIHVFHSL